MRLTEASIGVHVGDGTVKPHVFAPIDDTGPGYTPGQFVKTNGDLWEYRKGKMVKLGRLT